MKLNKKNKQEYGAIVVVLLGCLIWYVFKNSQKEKKFKEYVKNNPLQEPSQEVANKVYGLTFDEPYLD